MRTADSFSLTSYMNIALEQTEEYVNGKLTNSYGDAFVRGNNGKSLQNTILLQYHHLLNIIDLTRAHSCSALHQQTVVGWDRHQGRPGWASRGYG